VTNDDVVHGRVMPNLHVAHKADIVRMALMRDEGGVYLDSDVVALRSFAPLRRAAGATRVVMGREETPGQSGLCNAVLIAAPGTPFFARWWDAYRTFDPVASWAYHSVILPRELAADHPDEIVSLGPRALFAPTWTTDDLRGLYERDDNYTFIDNFGVHLWTSAETKRYGILAQLTPEDVATRSGSFFRVARRVLRDAAAAGLICDAARPGIPPGPATERVGRECGYA
jgi:hypothetical protein